MIILIFLQDFVGIWTKIAEQGIAIAVLALILVFVIVLVVKVLPTWKEVKIAEFNVRTKEAEATGQLSTSLNTFANAQTQLGTVLGQLGEIVKDIAIEQKRATDNVLILQRVNANENQALSTNVESLLDRMDTFEKHIKTD